jgi:hypothetical protein
LRRERHTAALELPRTYIFFFFFLLLLLLFLFVL